MLKSISAPALAMNTMPMNSALGSMVMADCESRGTM